ncbi:MAG: archaellin/type IV pilin N-terminal domain-containing protein [Patescibacteria group bacterium]|jgi:flagellin-like protein
MKNVLINKRGFVPLLGLVILLAVAIIAAGAIYYVAKSESTNTNSSVSVNTNNSNQNADQNLGGDRDEHGCIGSAGYSWCEIKSKCLRTWEEACAVVNTNSNTNDNTNANTNAYDTTPTDWKTYTNTKIGYTIGLPEKWNPVAGYDGRILPLQGDDDAPTFQDTSETTRGVSLTIQACSLIQPYLCAIHSITAWKSQVHFVQITDPELLVPGFEVGRDRDGTLTYLRENSKYFVYAYASKVAENDVQTILSTFQFTE